MPDNELLLERLERLAIVLDELMPQCAELVRNAISLLKEQEAVEPKEIVNKHFPIGDYRRTIGWLCGKCGFALMGSANYCSYCGQAVKWE